MLLHLEQVRREPVSWDQTVEVEVAELGRDDVLKGLGPVHWRGRVSEAKLGEDKAGESDAYYLSGHYAYRQELACQRCLEPVEQEVDGEITLLLVQDAPQPMDGDHQLEEEDLGVLYVDSDEFDTRPLLLEQMQLNVPMKPLCRDDCKGLCPHCGADLNAGDCDCRDDWVDPRWAALKDLKIEGSDAG